MTLSEIISSLNGLGYPVVYGSFDSEESLPNICIYEEPSDDRFADNSHYARVHVYNIEFFSSKKDPSIQESLESILDSTGSWSYEGDYILSEQKLIRSDYTIKS